MMMRYLSLDEMSSRVTLRLCSVLGLSTCTVGRREAAATMGLVASWVFCVAATVFCLCCTGKRKLGDLAVLLGFKLAKHKISCA